MECHHVMDRLSDYFDGELPPSNADEFARHFAVCEKCALALKEFSKLSALVHLSVPAESGPGAWDRLNTKLNAPSSSVLKPELPSREGGWMIAGILALAATLLVVLGFKNGFDGNSDPAHSHSDSVATSIDYSELVSSVSDHARSAMDSFSTKYEGEEVTLETAKERLGYMPSVSKALPAGVELVSTRVLKLPECQCAHGECTCGPNGCNCAASLCKRTDGTEFVVLEHCKSQGVSFGSLLAQNTKFGNQDVQWIESPNKGFSASWLSHDRRITAVGLKNSYEAIGLMAGVD